MRIQALWTAAQEAVMITVQHSFGESKMTFLDRRFTKEDHKLVTVCFLQQRIYFSVWL